MGKDNKTYLTEKVRLVPARMSPVLALQKMCSKWRKGAGRNREYALMGLLPAGSYNTKKYCSRSISIDSSVKQVDIDMLFDPQTSGGLVISLPEKKAKECLKAMQNEGLFSAIIGEVSEESIDGHLVVN